MKRWFLSRHKNQNFQSQITLIISSFEKQKRGGPKMMKIFFHKQSKCCQWWMMILTFVLLLLWLLRSVVTVASNSKNNNNIRGIITTTVEEDESHHDEVRRDIPDGVTVQIEEGAFTYYQSNSDNEKNDDAATSNNSVQNDPSSSASSFSSSSSSSSSCRTVLLLGVGAAMDSTEYSKLAIDIVTLDPSIVTIIVDDNPKKIPKQDSEKFAKLVHKIVDQLGSYIPTCATTTTTEDTTVKTTAYSFTEEQLLPLLSSSSPDILIGGHSASGEGAIAALSYLLSDTSDLYTPSIKGFVGLAPYKIPSNSRIDIPALFWGFSTMTCAVNVKLAADKAYQISNTTHRVLFQVQTNTEQHNPITGGPHCVFADHGCMTMCNPPDMQWIKNSVAISISTFVKAIQVKDAFTETIFQTILPPDTKLFVNQDELPGSSEIITYDSNEEERMMTWDDTTTTK